jgi:hypothetical protein
MEFGTDILIVKAALMFYTVYTMEDDPLLTMGDAVASFLERRDISTCDAGLLSFNEQKKGNYAYTRPWEGRRWRWKDTTSRRRRSMTFAM